MASQRSATTDQTERRRRGRLVAVLAGVALVLAGLSMMAYVGWQYVGTDINAERSQAVLKQEIRERWQQPTVGDVLGPQASLPQGSAAALIRIPRFGDDYEMPLIEGVRDQDLRQGVGHFAGAGPGQIGNFALAAHQVTHGQPFHNLPLLRPGDKVIVETSDATYTYVLDTDPDDLVVPFTETWVISPVPQPPAGEAPPGMPTFETPDAPTKAVITLTTSSEPFHTDERLVAFGHLVASSPK
ncbi:MAG: class E sortase [Nocardioidaceae bacterium]|nr:class E sortase [Nocardioidaceae bacterium]